MAEPATWQVATTSTLRVRATCSDVAVECGLVARIGSFQETARGTLDATFELAPFAGRSLQLDLSAEDSLGQVTSRAFTVFVASPSLEPVATVPGQLVDAEASRLLYAMGGGPDTPPTGLGCSTGRQVTDMDTN